MIHILIPNMNKTSIGTVINNFVKLDKHFLFKSINIVDLGSKNFKELSKTNYNRSINFIYNKNKFFNKSKAINLGINHLKDFPQESVLICDADIVIDKITLKLLLEHEACILEEVKESKTSSVRQAFGIIKVRISNLLDINGYDSRFVGWGFEDHDIIKRLSKKNAIHKAGQALHISHDDVERTQSYYTNNIEEMRQINLNYFNEKTTRLGTLSEDVSDYIISRFSVSNNTVAIYE